MSRNERFIGWKTKVVFPLKRGNRIIATWVIWDRVCEVRFTEGELTQVICIKWIFVIRLTFLRRGIYIIRKGHRLYFVDYK